MLCLARVDLPYHARLSTAFHQPEHKIDKEHGARLESKRGGAPHPIRSFALPSAATVNSPVISVEAEHFPLAALIRPNAPYLPWVDAPW